LCTGPKVAAAQGQPQKIPVQMDVRVWFNPSVTSTDFLVPGLIAIIMTLTGALLTAMVVAREWERGTMEALLVTPASIHEIIASKLLPYFVLGMGGMAISLGMAVWLFEVPLRGSLWLLLASSSTFLLCELGMGLLISTASRNQFIAGQIAITATFLPAYVLSGFLFDINSMPAVIQLITRIVAARYFVTLVQSIFLAGNIWPVILPNIFALVIMAAILLALVRRSVRKSLE
jgi:ABC-2 type transport system permease protein